MKKSESFKYLKSQLKGSGSYIFVAVCSIALGAFFEFLGPKLIEVTVDSIIGTKPFNLPAFILPVLEKIGGREFFAANIGAILLIFGGVSAFWALCEFLRIYSGSHLGEELGYKMRKSVFEHLQKATFGYHKNVQTGDIIQRCSSDIDMVRSFVVEMTQVVRVVAKIAIAYWFMFSISPTLSAISFISVPAISFFSIAFYGAIQKKFLVADEAEGDLQATAQENISAPRVVRAFGKQKQELENFAKKNDDFTSLWVKVGDLLALYWAGGDILTVLQIVLVLSFSTIFAVKGNLSTGEVVAFMTFNGMLAWPIRSLGRIVGNMSKATVALERIAEIMQAETEDCTGGQDFVFEKEIEFKDVNFSFERRKIFNNLSFKIKKGQTVAILGASGSGKSTILALLARFYTPDSGQILIDGTDINNINLEQLRKNIGIVLQEPFLFSKTIGENIGIACRNITQKEIEEAAKTAQIHNSILAFPQGYNTVVGEKGVTLSGGQKQRIAIARTLCTKAQLLCFDDSLSAVDPVTDKKIRGNLARLKDNLTLVIISQRVNTLMQADNILVLEKGTIVQQGNHDYLCTVEGIYKEIVKIQQDVIEKTKKEAGEQ